jgi:hypothetical protein
MASPRAPSTVHIIFNEKGNLFAAKMDQFKNKSPDHEHRISIDISSENIQQMAQYIGLSRKILYKTSYGETDERKKTDYMAIQLICRVMLSVHKGLPGFQKVSAKANVINNNIPTIYNELIPNAQKAIFENLMKDPIINANVTEKARRSKLFALLRQNACPEEKISALKMNPQALRELYLRYRQQLAVEDIDWFTDPDSRMELIQEAEKREMSIFFYFGYAPFLFEFGAKNKAYVEPRTLKKLNDKLAEPIKMGEDFLQAFNNSTSKIGAGLGLNLTRICIEEIATEIGTSAKAIYENDSKGMLIMNVSFDLR